MNTTKPTANEAIRLPCSRTGLNVFDDDDNIIAVCQKLGQAHAIATALNSYDGLVKALANLLAACDYLDAPDTESAERFNEALTESNAALAKAGK